MKISILLCSCALWHAPYLITFLHPHNCPKGIPLLRQNQKNGVFGDLILFEKLDFTIYLFTMAWSITHKVFMSISPPKGVQPLDLPIWSIYPEDLYSLFIWKLYLEYFIKIVALKRTRFGVCDVSNLNIYYAISTSME